MFLYYHIGIVVVLIIIFLDDLDNTVTNLRDNNWEKKAESSSILYYEFLLSSIDDVGGCRVRIRVYKSGASFSRLIRKYILAHY